MGALNLNRRDVLKLAGVGAMSWLMPDVAFAQEAKLARSLIVLWLDGGPSQLETFDPHPGGAIGGPTRTIKTRIDGVSFCSS